MKRLIASLLLLALLLPMITVNDAVQAQGIGTARAISNVNMRSGPEDTQPVITVINANSSVTINGRNRIGNWLHVTDSSGTSGWAVSRYFVWSDAIELGTIPVVDGSNGGAVALVSGANTTAAPATAQAWTSVSLNLREQPVQESSSLGVLPANTGLVLLGRSDNNVWAYVLTTDGQLQGWIAANFLWLAPSYTIEALPIGVPAAVPPAAAPVDASAAAAAPAANVPVTAANSGMSIPDLEAYLSSIPVLPVVTDSARAIYTQGQTMGNRANVFTSAGDCFTDHVGFLKPFGAGTYHLGAYGSLQATINFFSASPYAGLANSFLNSSLAAGIGYSSGSVIDPLWTDPQYCNAGESLLACEYRRMHPAIAIIQFGNVDVQVYEEAWFDHDMRVVVETSMARGVVPILSTSVVASDYPYYHKSLEFNRIIVQIARDYDLPLINFWLAAQSVAHAGTIADGYHPSDDWGFLGGQHYDNIPALSLEGVASGMTMRNLIVLQSLDEFRRNLLGG